MSLVRLKQFAQDGATDGQCMVWNNSSGLWVPATRLANIVEDTTPQLGGTLDCQSNEIDNVEVITYEAEHSNGNSGASFTVNWNNGQHQSITLTANCTFTFTAPAGPGSFILKVLQDATGSRTATWPATVEWSGGASPTLTTTASAKDLIAFYYDGTNYHGQFSGDYS